MGRGNNKNVKGYVYCKEHDIYFNEKLKKQADAQNEKFRKKGIYVMRDACPMCQASSIFSVMSMGANIAKEHNRHNRRRF